MALNEIHKRLRELMDKHPELPVVAFQDGCDSIPEYARMSIDKVEVSLYKEDDEGYITLPDPFDGSWPDFPEDINDVEPQRGIILHLS